MGSIFALAFLVSVGFSVYYGIKKNWKFFRFAIAAVVLSFIGVGIVGPLRETKQVEVKSEVLYSTVEKKDNSIPAGKREITQAGKKGERTVTYEVTYENGKEKSRKQISEKVTIAPVDEIVIVGTQVAASSSPTSPAATSSGSGPTQPTSNGSSVYYANCTEVRNAGAAPIYRGQPGYRSALDRDGDGVACE